jgi:hypothetical protein
MARRDTAYDTAVQLIKEHLFTYSEEGRSGIYEDILRLLDTAIESTRLIAPANRETSKDNSGAVFQYLVVLKDTVKAAATLVKHELVLFEDENTLTEFIGAGITTQFRSADEIFSNSEMNIYHCISELVECAEPTIEKYREYWKKSFSRNNLERYNKSFAEFENVYNKYISNIPEKRFEEDID